MRDFKKILTLSQYLFLGFIITFSSTEITPARAYSTSNKLNVQLWFTPSHYGSTEALVADVIQSNLQASGMINVQLKFEDWPTMINDFSALKLPFFLLGWYPDYVDPDDYMYSFGTTAGTNSIGTNYTNSSMNTAAVNARIATSQSARTTIYQQMQNQLARDSPEIPLWQGISEAFTTNKTHGVVLDASTIFRYYSLNNQLSNASLRIGTTDSIAVLDPAKADDYYSVNVLQNIGDGLLGYVPGSNNLKLDMATNYIVSSSGLNYTVAIRSGLKFANGDPINATTFKTSILRARDLNGDPSYLLQGLVQSINVINATAFRINLFYPFSVFPALMAAWVTYPTDPKYQNSTGFNNKYQGSGPYKIASYTPGVELDLSANTNYYGAAALVPSIKIFFYSNSGALRTALESKQLDVAYRTFDPSDSIALSGETAFSHTTGPGAVIRYLVLNTNMPPFNDVRARQAVAYLVNRTQIATSVFANTVQNLCTMVPIGMWSSIPAWCTLYGSSPNIAAAQALLSSITVPVAPPLFLVIIAPLLLGAVFVMRRKVSKV